MTRVNFSQKRTQIGKYVSAPARERSAFRLKTLSVYLMLSFGTNGYALPLGGSVTSGAASISSNSSSSTITQSSQNAAINWQGFSIGQSETVQFIQPSASSVILNRVIGYDASNILGSMTANGKVFLVNPNGILFGKSAQVNVGGLVASTLNITDSDFMTGKYTFSGASNATVLNLGSISTNGDGQYVALLGANVGNDGFISAKLGTIALAVGTAITLDVVGDGLLNVAVNQGAVNALVQNSGLIQADGGLVLMTAQAAGNLLATVVNNTGQIQAQTIQNINGRIKMLGDMQSGIVNVAGTLDASAPNGGNGGFIETSAAQVKIANNAKINTTSTAGLNGSWLIDPFDFTIAASGDITGTALSGLLVTNSIIISTSAGANSSNNLFASAGLNGDIFVNDALTWTASAAATTLTLNAFRDVNIAAAITATKGNLVSTAGRNVNVKAAVKTTNGNVTSTAGNDVNVNAAITTVTGGVTANAGNNVNITAGITTTTGNVVLQAGNNGNGIGTVIFTAPGTVTLNTGNAYIYYNPGSYNSPTLYTSDFTGNGIVNSYMWVFVQGDNKTYDGTNSATLSFVGTPTAGGAVTLVDPGSGATYSGKNASNGKTINYAGFTLGGADANKFSLFSSSGTTTGTIAGRVLTVTAASNSKTYDGNTSSSGPPTFGSLQTGDTGNFAQHYDNKNVGTSKVITASGSVSDGNGGNNYVVNFVTDTTGVIIARTLTISGITASNKVYDGSANATIQTGATIYNGLVSGDSVSVNSTGVFSDKNVANGKTVTITSLSSGADAGNYSITNQAFTFANISAASVFAPSIPVIIAPAIDVELHWLPTIALAETLSDQSYDRHISKKSMAGKFNTWHGSSQTKAETKPGIGSTLTTPPVEKVLVAEVTLSKEPVREDHSFISLKIVGSPLDGGKFAKLKIGMTIKQVEELIGAPDWTWQQYTGSDSTPYYTGTDPWLVQYTYKSEGMLTFNQGQERVLIRMLVNRAG